MATGQSQKSMTLPSRTQPPKPGNHRNKLSSPSFNRGLFGRLVQKLRFRNRDTDTEFPDSQNVEGLYFKRKLSPEHKDPPNQSAFARVDVRRSQSDRSYQRPVEMRKKTGAFPKLRRSRHSKEVAEILPPHDKKPLASDIEVANDFIISDGAGVDLDEGNKEEQIPLEDIDPGYETLDEVREKMKNLKLKKLKEEVETKAPVHVQHHRRTQSTGGQEEAGGRENSEFDISSKERLGMNSSHIDLNRPNSQQLNSRNHLLPNLTSNILSVRSGSCPLHHENSLQTGILSSQNKSENCLSQGGVVWKETEDVYANPSIVHNKTKQGVENTPEGPSMLCSAMNREESVDKEPPPLPERQYSVQSLEDIDASEQVPCNRDPGFSDHVSEQDSNHTTQEADTIPKSLEVKVGPEDEEENGYSTCGSSVAPFQRRERIYEEIKDRDFRTLQCSNEEDTTACSVPYQTYVRKERPYEDIKDLQLDSGICNTSSGTDFFAQVMNHYDSLSENVSSAGPCDTSADDLETDCGSESNKTCENMELLNAVVGANSAKTDSAVTDMSLSSDQPISNFNSFSSSVEQCDTVKMKTTTQEKGGKSDLVDFQPQSNSATTDSLECRNVQANLHTEQKDKVVIHSEYPPRIEASYEDDADLVLESLHSQAIPSGVSSIENLLEYERSMEDSMKKLIDVDSADKWEEIPYADSASLGLGDTPQSLPDDGYSECGDVQQDSAAVSLIIMESDLGCDQDSASQTVATEESGITSTGENKVEKEEVSAVKGAMGGDLQEENVQNIPNEVVEVQWRPKELPHKTIPSFYYDEEPVHMSLSELGMKEKFNKHSKEKETHKKKQKEGKSSSPRQQSSRNSSQVKASGSSRIKVRDSSLRQTAVHKNPAARRTYPMGMAKSLETEKEHKDPVETKLSRSATSSEKPCRDVKAKSSFVEPVTLPEIPKFNQNSEVRCRKDFLESMKQLKDCGWYWGPLSWDEAEIKLLNKPDGSFLVRDSSDERYILSLSFNMNGHVHHTRIEHHKGKFSFWSQPDSLGKSTIKEFIEQCVRNSRNGQFLYFIRPSGPGAPPMPVHLLHPVSRFRQMQSLQHMCRFQILQIVRRDHIEQLPIPTSIKDYLRQSQYYVEYLED